MVRNQRNTKTKTSLKIVSYTKFIHWQWIFMALSIVIQVTNTITIQLMLHHSNCYIHSPSYCPCVMDLNCLWWVGRRLIGDGHQHYFLELQCSGMGIANRDLGVKRWGPLGHTEWFLQPFSIQLSTHFQLHPKWLPVIWKTAPALNNVRPEGHVPPSCIKTCRSVCEAGISFCKWPLELLLGFLLSQNVPNEKYWPYENKQFDSFAMGSAYWGKQFSTLGSQRFGAFTLNGAQFPCLNVCSNFTITFHLPHAVTVK